MLIVTTTECEFSLPLYVLCNNNSSLHCPFLALLVQKARGSNAWCLTQWISNKPCSFYL